MIVLKRVFIRNFLSIKEADVALDNQGLVLVEGVNKDDPSALSNGAGKSSFVDAISWALFGVTARGSTGDAVVNLKAGRETVVEVYLEVDGQPYVIMRGRKHKVLKNRVMLRLGTVDLTLGTDKLTQERINNLLGCSVETFNAAIYMGQENMPDLPNMTDKALKQVLEEAMGLNKLDTATDLANERIKDVENQISHIESSIRTIKRDMDYTTHEITLLEDQQKECANDIAMMKDEIQIIGDTHATNIRHLERDLRDVQDALAAVRPGAGPDIEKYTKDQLALLLELKDQLAGYVKERRDCEMAAEQTKQMIVQLRKKTGPCPTCNQALPDGHDAETKIEALKAQFKEQWDLVTKAQIKVTALELVIDKHHADTAETLGEMKVAAAKLPDPAALKSQKVELEMKIAKEVATHKMRYDRLCDSLDRKRNLTDSTARAVNTKIMENVDRKHRLNDFEETLMDLRTRMDVLGKVKHALGRKGFRGEVLDQVTPYLNARTQHYLETLSDENIEAVWSTVGENSDGDYTENFHIEVRHKSGVDRFANLSGGEKRKVRLACALALQDLVATRAVKPIKLFIADEIDDAIDAAGLELLMGLLEAKARDLGTVFIISHNDLADWCRNKITVTKQDGVSTFAIPT